MTQCKEVGYTHKAVLLDIPKKVMEYAGAIQEYVPVNIHDKLIEHLVVSTLPLESGSPDVMEPIILPDEAYRACVEECIIDKSTGEIMDMDQHDPGVTNTELLESYIPPDLRPKVKQLAFEAHDELYQLWMECRMPPETRVHDVRTVSATGVICDFAVNTQSLPPENS